MDAKRFRYDTSKHWYKGNTHIHSTVSDGGLDFGALARQYAESGFKFLFRTDHWATSGVARDTDSYPLVWMDGVELDGVDDAGAYLHVVCLGTLSGITASMGVTAAMNAARAQGAMIIIAHPFWSGNTFDECIRHTPDAVEVYNHVCRWLNGKSDSHPYWQALLKHNPDTLALASDDAHCMSTHPGWNGGWIVINAPECTPSAIMTSIRRGNYYSSCGPDFHALEYDGSTLHVRTSPVQFLRVVGPASCGQCYGGYGAARITDVRVTVPQDWDYVYVEIENEHGARAWTNTLFTASAATR